MRWKLAEMYRDIEAGRSLLYRACVTADPFPDPYEAAIAKMYCNEMSIRVTSEAIQVHGGYGFTDEYPRSRASIVARATERWVEARRRRFKFGKRIMDATETGAELLAYDMMSESDLNI